MNGAFGSFDPTRRAAFERSLTVGNAGTVLLQTTISRVVQHLTNRQLGIQSTLPVRPGSGDAFYSNRRTAAATGGAWIADTAEPTESEGAYTQVSFGFKSLVGRIKVTRKLIAQGRSYGDVLATELVGKAEDFFNDLETACAVGDTNANANQIDGLLTLIGNVSGQTVANTTADAGDSLYLDKLDTAIQTVKGAEDRGAMRIYGSYKGTRLMNNALQAQQRFNDEIDIDAGFRVRSYNGIPIITSTAIPDDMTWDYSELKVTVFSGAASTALIVVNTNYVFFSELTSTTVMPLAKTSSQFDQVDMFRDLVLVLDNTLGGAILAGLA